MQTPNKTGYEFVGWHANEDLTEKTEKILTGSFGDKKFYAKWQVVVYSIEYELNGGENNALTPNTYTIESEEIVLQNPSKIGYEFVGWYSSDNPDKGVDLPSVPVNGNENTQIEVKTIRIPKGSYGNKKFYAKWQVVVYTIEYELNGGENNPLNPLTYTIESKDIVLKSSSKTGYDFVGWYVDESLTEKTEKIVTGSYGNKKFYTKWMPTVYSIKYELNGGENNPENSLTYTIESNDIVLQTPNKTGYDFAGWYSNEGFAEKIEKIATGSYGDKKFYAKWQVVVYTIKYELNGGENNSLNPDTYTIENDNIVLQTPSRTGYNFIGWYEDEILTKNVKEIVAGSYSNRKFYAKWQVVVYTIEYILNGGVNNSLNTTIYMIESDDIVLQSPSKIGYDFVNWYEDEDLTKRVEKIMTGSYGNRKFYAKWQVIVYSIEYELNGGENNSLNQTTYTIESKEIVLQTPSKTGYNFVGWYIDESLTEKTEKIVTGSYNNKKFYAKWQVVVYSIEYELNGGENNFLNPTTYTIESEDIVLQMPSKIGYKFIGWDSFDNPDKGVDLPSIPINGQGNTQIEVKTICISQGSYGNKKFLAKWQVVIYSIEYELNGGENNPLNPSTYTIESDEIVLLTPSKTGYNFIGWYVDEDLTEKVEAISTGSYDNKKFYAKWVPTVYTIEYVLNDREDSSENPIIYTIESKEIVSQSPSKIDYDFVGWFTDKALTEKVEKITTGSQGDKKFYAKWVSKYYLFTDGAITGLTDYGRTFTELIIPVELYGVEVKSIGVTAFEYCDKLTKITIPNSVQSIGFSAFSGCGNLTSVTIGSGVKTISNSAFLGCNSISDIYIADLTAWCNITGLDNLMKYGLTDKSLYLDNSLLTDLVVPDDVTSISDYAFKCCTNLKSVIVGNSVKYIGSNAFCQCSKLSNIIIPNSVQSIGSNTFSDCSNLASVTIGSGVKTISNFAFSGCSSISGIYITNLTAWCNITGLDNLMKYGLTDKSLYLDNSLLTDLVVPDDVPSISDYAFYGYSKLASIIISNGVITIGSYAFNKCDSLTSVIIGSSVKSIGSQAFYGCNTLVEVINKSSIFIDKGSKRDGYVGYYALNIKKDGVTDIVNKDGYLFYSYDNVNYLLEYVGVDTELILPNNFNGQNYQIYEYAFSDVEKLTSVIIGDSVTSIGNRAFYLCSNLQSITIGNGLTYVGDYAFYGCGKLANMIIPDSVTTIGSSAFNLCSSLASVTIGSSVESIGKNAFSLCYALVEVINNSSLDIVKGGANYGDVGHYALNVKSGGDTDIIDKDGYLFYSYDNVNYLIGYIGNETQLILPSNYNGEDYQIHKYAFNDKNSLTNITITNSVTSIGEFAFKNCKNLTSITIGTGVTYIGKNVFSTGSRLKIIYYTGTEEQWNAITKENSWDSGQNDYTVVCNA